MTFTETVPRRALSLPPGGTVGIVSPSSPGDPASLDAGIAALQSRGFQVAVAPHARDRHGHMAGLDADRAADFFQCYADPQIDALWCARGGSSAIRLWPLLDWDALAALPPKIVVGFSDITSLHVPLNQNVGVVSLHGPMISDIGQPRAAHLLDWELNLLAGGMGDAPGRADDTLTGGTAEGRLCGGCLSLLAATLGTPYQLDARGKLLLIEDVHEAPHRIERYLAQLGAAGILESAAGFVVGAATGADDSQTRPIREIWTDFVGATGKPAALGFPFGHVAENWALPLGVRARLNADAGMVTLLEPAVQEPLA